MNETKFVSKTSLNFYAARRVKRGIVKINGHYYRLEKIQELFEVLQMPWKSILLYGPPGGGKTHLAREVIPVLMEIIFKAEVKTYYNNLGDFTNNVSDFKYFPVLENNSLRYVKSNLVLLNEQANSNPFCVLNIFDEVSRLSNAAQNLLLPLTEDNKTRAFLLGHMGESVFIKKESVNVLLMNPVGGGTTEVNEALLDRTAVISVPEPSIDDLSLLFNSDVVEETEFEDLSVLNPLEIKKLTRDQKSMVIDFFKPFKLSIRQFKEIFWFLENSPFPAQRLADFIKNRVDLNIIQSKQFSMIQIEKTEIPELIRYLDYPMF